ncbi:MAG: hypothetical protein JW832_10935 [Deltaproteobacteria bacterium]|nr:hypothetical protein [Deltaproteobacteria bacterium]
MKKFIVVASLLLSMFLMVSHDADAAPSPLTIEYSLPASTETPAGSYYFILDKPVPYNNVELSWNFSNGMDETFNTNIKNISVKEKGSAEETFFSTDNGTQTTSPAGDLIITNPDFIYLKGNTDKTIRKLTLKPATVDFAADKTYVVTIYATLNTNTFLSNNSAALIANYTYEFTTSRQLAITSVYPAATESATVANYYVIDMPVAHDNATFQWEFTNGWDNNFAQNIANITISEKGVDNTTALFDTASGTKTAPIPGSVDNESLQIENADFYYMQEFDAGDNADVFMLELKPATVALKPNKTYVITISAGSDNSSLFQDNDNTTLIATYSYEFSTNDSVSVVSFTATPGNRKVTLAWTTDDEKANQGFNILRATSPDGPFEQINETLIPSQGSNGAGSDYSYIDKPLRNRSTYYYKLENIDTADESYTRGEADAKPRLLYFWKELIEFLRGLR